MNTKAITRFILYFFVLYGAVILTSAAGDKAYADYFRAFGKQMLEYPFGNAAVRFMEYENNEQPKFSTNLRLSNKKDIERYLQTGAAYPTFNARVSSWYSGYLPTMLTLSLIVAIPGMKRKQKLIGLLAGMIVIHLFIFLKLYIQIVYEFGKNEWLKVITFSSTQWVMIDNLYYLFVTSMGLNFIVPLLIFVVVVLIFENDLIGAAEK